MADAGRFDALFAMCGLAPEPPPGGTSAVDGVSSTAAAAAAAAAAAPDPEPETETEEGVAAVVGDSGAAGTAGAKRGTRRKRAEKKPKTKTRATKSQRKLAGVRRSSAKKHKGATMRQPRGLTRVDLTAERAAVVPVGGPKTKARIMPQPVLAVIGDIRGRGTTSARAAAAARATLTPGARGADMPKLNMGLFDELALRASNSEVTSADPTTLKRKMAITLNEYSLIKMRQQRGSNGANGGAAAAVGSGTADADVDARAEAALDVAAAAAAAAAAPAVAGGGTPADDSAPPTGLPAILDQYFSGEWEAPPIGAQFEMQEHLRRIKDMVGDIQRLEDAAREVVDDQDTRRVGASAGALPPPADAGAGAGADAGTSGTDDVIAHMTLHPRPDVLMKRLECIDRSYAYDFLRQGVGVANGERECARFSDCVFNRRNGGVYDNTAGDAKTNAFICREFLLPSEKQLFADTKKLPDIRRMCLGCNRYWTAALFFSYHATGEQPTACLQDHYVLTGDVGAGYDATYCLPMATSTRYTGIVLPFVRFVPSGYDPHPFSVKSLPDGDTPTSVWQVPGVTERGTVFRKRPSSYDRSIAERHADRQEFASALARGDRRAAADAETRLFMRDSDRSAERAVAATRLVINEKKFGIPKARVQRPPHAWVAGPPGLEIVGLPRAAPFRPMAYLRAEAVATPLPVSVVPTPMREVTPRVLLGRIYPTLKDTIFCPFRDTMAIAAACFDEMLGPRIRATTVHLYGIPRVPVLDDVLEKTAECTVAAAVLLRVHAATTLMRTAADADTRYLLALFMDTHLDLADVIRQFEQFRDAELCDGLFNRMGINSTLVDQFPHDMRFADSGSLPDISSCLPYAAVFYTTDARLYSGTVMEAIVHMFANKPQSQKCKGRNMSQILRQYRKKHPQLMTLMRAIIIVSLLGNYTHAKFRPCFETRLYIMRVFSPVHACDDTIMAWVSKNGDFVYAMIKEFYRFTVTLDPAFETVLLLSTYWNTVQRAYALAMDRVRGAFDMSFTCGFAPGFHAAALASGIEDIERVHTVCELACASKLRKGQFTTAVVKEMNHFFNVKILSTNYARPQNSLVKLAEIIGRPTTELVIRAMYYVVSTRISRHFARDPVEFFWMSFFGLSRECLSDLRALAYDFEHKETADKAVSARIAAIYTRRPADFFVIHVYFAVINEWRSRQSFQLPDNYLRAQEIALRAKWDIPPWDALPAVAYTMHYCPNCKRWLSDVVDASIPTTRIRMASMGARKCMYYAPTGRLYCASQRVAVATRRLFETGVYDDLGAFIPDTTEAKCARNFAETPPCANTPAVSVDMRGRVQMLGGRMYALCTKCASLCPWIDSRVDSTGFTCGFHGENTQAPKTTRQEDQAMVRAKRTQHSIIDKCSYCPNTITANSDYSRFSVFDDVDTQDYVRYTLCATCSAPFGSWAPLRQRSRVDEAIRLRREAFRLARPNFGISKT